MSELRACYPIQLDGLKWSGIGGASKKPGMKTALSGGVREGVVNKIGKTSEIPGTNRSRLCRAVYSSLKPLINYSFNLVRRAVLIG